MIFAALNEAAERGELLLLMDGLCRFHKRKDGVVVIREVIVLPFRRRTGVGRNLVRLVAQMNRGCVLRAKCPACSGANEFWRAMGFGVVFEDGGFKVWELDPS